MRYRDTEWDNPMLRFVGAFFIPPALSSFLLITVLTISVSIQLSDIPAAVFSYSFNAIFATAVPSIIFFLILEKLYETKETIRASRARFSLFGLFMGTIFGGAIGVYLEGIPIYINLGWIVGFATAYIIFPKKKNETKQEPDKAPVSAPC